MRETTVLVIGAGQAGLSAAYHLRRRGFASALSGPTDRPTFAVLDAEEGPGGAWRHRWESLTVSSLNAIFDLPDHPAPRLNPNEPSATAVSRYFATFEASMDLPILRPVTVQAVREAGDAHGSFFVDSTAGTWRTRETIAKVVADVEAGNPTGSVVSYTGLVWSDYALAAKRRGALERRPMFTSIEPYGVREADGHLTTVDAIVWATGFKADLAHLEGLGLRNERGGIRMSGTQVAGEPRIHLIGFGPSQSTVGANRAGRQAAAAIRKHLQA